MRKNEIYKITKKEEMKIEKQRKEKMEERSEIKRGSDNEATKRQVRKSV